MEKSLWGWICWFGFLLILDLVVPFTFLKNTAVFAGSFLFWLIWIVVAIISMFVIFLKWQDNES